MQNKTYLSVGPTGFEPATSSVSRKRATTAPTAREKWRWRRDSNPCIRLCRPLPRLSATPPEWLTPQAARTNRATGADDETRTRDPHLGKVMRYQLRYIRMFTLPCT